MEFLYLFIHRALSGAQNGLGYARSPWRTAATIALILMGFALIAYVIATPGPTPWYIAAGLCGALSAVAAEMVHISFQDRGGYRIFDIHFWEIITTSALAVGVVLAGGNVLLVAASAYPGLILHKGFVNLGSGLPWWDSRTDDASGDTFSIPLLNISIPRSSTTLRVVLAVGSLLLAVLTLVFNWRFNVIVS